jgi:hypothetical protein
MDCKICKWEIFENIIILECNHIFHKECINMWFKISPLCPICKGSNKIKQNFK